MVIKKIHYNFASVLSNKLIKKGGGTGPVKPWQPVPSSRNKVPIPTEIRSW